MKEWLKFHTYVVCNTKRSAKGQMIEDYWYYCQRFGWKNFINMNRSKLRIESKHKVRQYVSVQQFLHYFDRVDDVDLFELDTTCSEIHEDELKETIHVLYQARIRTDRDKQRVKRLEEHDWVL